MPWSRVESRGGGLQSEASPDSIGGYPFSITTHQGMRIVKLGELLAAVIDDLSEGVSVPIISARFHNTISEMIVEMCCALARERGLSQVALSGGVFQNRLLLRLATSALRTEGFDVLTHSLVPTNDGGISLGQAVVANFAQVEGDFPSSGERERHHIR